MSKHLHVHTPTLQRTGTVLRKAANQGLGDVSHSASVVGNAIPTLDEGDVAAAVEHLWQAWSQHLQLAYQTLDEVGRGLHGAAGHYSHTETRVAGTFQPGRK